MIFIQISNFMKICPVGDELIHADEQKAEKKEQADMTKSKVAFAIFFRTRLKITFICEVSNLNSPRKYNKQQATVT